MFEKHLSGLFLYIRFKMRDFELLEKFLIGDGFVRDIFKLKFGDTTFGVNHVCHRGLEVALLIELSQCFMLFLSIQGGIILYEFRDGRVDG